MSSWHSYPKIYNLGHAALAQLYRWALPHVNRIAIQGLPDWYKEELVKLQFEEKQ